METVSNVTDKAGLAQQQSWESLPSNAVVVVFKDKKLVKADFERHVALMAALIKNRHPKITDERLQKNIEKGMPNVLEELISRLLLVEGLALTNTAVEVSQTVKELKLKWEKRFCRKGQKFDDLVQCLSKDGVAELFLARFDQDALFETALNTTYASHIFVTEEEYTNSVVHIERYNKIATATNDLNWAVASNVLKRIESGEDFAKLADLYSQDPDKEPGGDLGECDISSLRFGDGSEETFSKTPYWKAVSGLYDGQHTGILETDVGLEIIKRYSYIAPTNSNTGLPAAHLARIYFRRAYVYPKQSEKDFRYDLKVEKRENFLKSISDAVQKDAKLVFPLGVDIFPKAQEGESKQSRRRSRAATRQ